MTPDDRRRLIDLGRWHLDEAERLDKLAAEPYDPPPLVASVAEMTEAWMLRAARPESLRRSADSHRREARRIFDRLANHKE